MIRAYLTKERESLFLNQLNSNGVRKSFVFLDSRIDVKIFDINIYLLIYYNDRPDIPAIVYVFDRTVMRFHRAVYFTNEDGKFFINPKTDKSRESEAIQGLLATCKSYPRLDVFAREVA